MTKSARAEKVTAFEHVFGPRRSNMLFTPQHYLLFCAGAFTLILTPGPDFFYVVTRGLAGGRKVGIVSALGIGGGLLVHTFLAASGLTLLLQASPAAFHILKWLGALYLIWMGWKLLSSGDELFTPTQEHEFPLKKVFQQGILTNVLNPKVALTFLLFILPFVQRDKGNAPLQIAVLGITLCVLATSWFSVVGLFAGQMSAFLIRNKGAGQAISRIAGVVVMLLGIYLALG